MDHQLAPVLHRLSDSDPVNRLAVDMALNWNRQPAAVRQFVAIRPSAFSVLHLIQPDHRIGSPDLRHHVSTDERVRLMGSHDTTHQSSSHPSSAHSSAASSHAPSAIKSSQIISASPA